MRSVKRLAIAAFAILCAASDALAVELAGAIRSATGKLPDGIQVSTVRTTDLPAIVGKVANGRYRISLPDAGRFVLQAKAPDWDGAPKTIWDPKTAAGLDFLIYPAALPEPALSAELIEMGRQDQAVRAELKPPDKAALARMADVDRANEARLGAIIDATGWPAISVVGYEAASSAWAIAQHASPSFLKRCLPLMLAAAQQLEMASGELALSIDRDRMYDGKPQVYGSQLRAGADGRPALYPIEDREHVDERRAAMGLEPLAQYLGRFD